MANEAASSGDISVECSETSPVVRSLTVEVAAARVNKAFGDAYGKLKKTAQIKGFRPGKVPRSVLERMYGAGMPGEIERVLVGATIADAIEQAGVVPVAEPDIDAEPPAQGSPFRYTARVEVKPPIELPDLSALEGTRTLSEVTDEQIDAELERIRSQHEQYVEEPEDTVAADGHQVTVDFVGRVDGEPFEGGTGQGMNVTIGSGNMVPGFEEQLVGAKSGDDVQVSVTFPEEYGSAQIAGKPAVFDCHVVAIRRRELPALDDEFAKDLGDFESLEMLQMRIRSDMQEKATKEVAQALNQSLMTSLIEASDFEVPQGLVDRQLQQQLQSMHQQFNGQVPEEVLHQQLDRMRQDGRPAAERRVREYLLLDALAEAEDISASDDDIEARLHELAESQGSDPEKMRSMAEEQGWLDAIEMELRDERIYEHLAAKAKIEEFAPAAATGEAGKESTDEQETESD
jgi:trigger factor